MQALVTYLNTLTTPELKRIADTWQAILSDRLYQGNAYHLSQEMTSDYLIRRQVARLSLDQLTLVSLFCQKPDFSYTLPELSEMVRPNALDVNATLTRLREAGLVFYERVKAEASPAVPRKFGMATLPKNTVPALQTLNFVIPRELARPLRRISIERLGNEPTEADTVLQNLTLDNRSTEDGPVALIRQAIGRSKAGVRPSGQPVQRLLSNLEIDLLETKAELWNTFNAASDSDRNSLIAALARSLADADEQQRYISDHFTPEQSRLFTTLQTAGRLPRTTLLQQYHTEPRLSRILRPLVDALLVWESFENGIEVVFVPQEVAHPVRDEARRNRVALQTVTAPNAITHAPPYALAWDSLTFLNHIIQNEVELTSTNNTIPKRVTKKILDLLWTGPLAAVKSVPGEISALGTEPAAKTRKRKPAATAQDDEQTISINGRRIGLTEYLDAITTQRLDFVVTLCGLLDLYQLEERKLTGGSKLPEYIHQDFPEQMRRLLLTWITHPWRSGPLSYPYYYARGEVIVKVNKTMLGWLEECDVDVWYSLDSLVAKIHQTDPFYFRPRKELLQQYDTRLVDEITKNWKAQEGYIIRQTFNTLFEWLGIVRVGRDENYQPIAFSLTTQGRWLVQFIKNTPLTALLDEPHGFVPLEDMLVARPAKAAQSSDSALALEVALKASEQVRPASPDMGAEKSLLVQPNFEILYFAPHPTSLWTLLQFADPIRIDQVAIFGLNRLALLRGLASGLLPHQISAFLNERSQQPVPDNVAINLSDWARNFKRVLVSRATLLETEDPAVLDDLEKLALVSSLMVRRISPTTAIIQLPGEDEAAAAPRTQAAYYSYGTPRPFDFEDKMKALRTKLKAAGYFSK